MFSINFDTYSNDFNQLLQTSFQNLVYKQAYHLPPQPPSTGILVSLHAIGQIIIPNNNGWHDFFYPPQCQSQGWISISLPLPPPPPPAHLVHHAISMASNVHFTLHGKAKTHEPETRKCDKEVMATKSRSSHKYSHYITSHARHHDQQRAKAISHIRK